MTLALAWVVFPLILLAMSLGSGLLVEAILGLRLPAALLPGLGFAVMIVAGQALVYADATAELATPVLVAIAAAGFALRLRSGLPRPSVALTVAVAGVFAVFAAPVVLSGQATFAGYIKLDDTATWMALTDRVMEHGRSLDGLHPSTYEATLAFNLGSGYPIGAFVPLGVARELIGQDVAWLVQPYMAFTGALLALALWSLAAPLVEVRWLRAVVAFLAAQPALLYGYYLWGGIKEVAAAALIATVTALLVHVVRRWFEWRDLCPPAIAVAALVGVLSAGGLIWVAPVLVGTAVLAFQSRGRRATAALAAGFVALTALLALPALLPGLKPPTSAPLTSATALGNLIGPLGLEQGAGIWPAGDSRVDPAAPLLTGLLIAAALVVAVWAVVVAWRRRSPGPLLYAGGVVLAALVIHGLGSPWVGGKALATASPAIPFAALLGGALLWQRGGRLAGAAVLVVIAGGILWSNALAYRDVSLAPRDQLAELESIGERIAGQGPALMTEYQPYGVRHFLREADAEGASELRRSQVPLVSGRTVPKGEYADTDRFDPAALLEYQTLVLRRSPSQSRPPSPYALDWRGDYYEVWQRPPGPAPAGIEHVGLGTGAQPVGEPSCRQVRALAASSPQSAELLAAARAPAVVVPMHGTLRATARVPAKGTYEIWLGGSARPEVEAAVDGQEVGEVRHQLENAGQYVSFGTASLQPGSHEIAIQFGGSDLHPGSGGRPGPVGPLVLSRTDAADVRLVQLPRALASRLCHRRWDWIELVP